MTDSKANENVEPGALLSEDELAGVTGGMTLNEALVVCSKCRWSEEWLLKRATPNTNLTPDEVIENAYQYLSGKKLCPECGSRKFEVYYSY
jgi:Zn finger protein HypA/HybF involved in hydrogenase expression